MKSKATCNSADFESQDLIRSAVRSNAELEPSARREFLHKCITVGGWGAMLLCTGAGMYETVKFFFPSVVFQPPSQFKIGSPADFTKPGSQDAFGVIAVDDRFKTDHRFFIIREPARIYALYARCTHLGCTINWFPGIQTFKCPCHGSEFHSNGRQFAGPAPRPLDRLRINLDAQGSLVVDTRTVFSAAEFEEKQIYIKVTT